MESIVGATTTILLPGRQRVAWTNVRLQGSSVIQFGCHGHTVFGLAVRRESPVSKQHDHVEESMIVTPSDRSLNQ